MSEKARCIQNLELPKQLVAGLEVVFDVFYRDRVVIKIRPLPDSPVATSAGVLKPRVPPRAHPYHVYKYGLVPAPPWRMLAQIAAIPREGQEPIPSFRTGGDIEQSMMAVFDSRREVQTQVQCVSFPEVAVTPIALYRE